MQLSSPNVLVVDDDPVLLDLLADTLAPVSAAVHIATSANDALHILQSRIVDVIVTDVCLPGERGTTLLAYAAERQNDPAVIVISGNATLNDALEGVHLHASDFLLKPFSKSRLTDSVLRAFAELEERRSLVRNVNLAASERLQLQTLVATLDACEHETCSHSLRVLEYCFHLADMVGYPDSQLPELARAALLHDIGKIGIPPSILRKPSRLTTDEFDIMKSHVLKGVRILERVPSLRACIPIVLNHHENFNGNGYPNGAQREEIPLGARIFSVVDTLDAMTSDRPYRKALSFDAATAEIQRCAGQQFDPVVTEAFLKVPTNSWKELRRRADCNSSPCEQVLMRVLRRNSPITDLGDSTYNALSRMFV